MIGRLHTFPDRPGLPQPVTMHGRIMTMVIYGASGVSGTCMQGWYCYGESAKNGFKPTLLGHSYLCRTPTRIVIQLSIPLPLHTGLQASTSPSG